MSQTVVEKIAQAHLAEGPNRPLRTGDVISLRPRHILTHDNTAAVMEKFKSIGALAIHDPKQPVFALDHDIQNTSEANLAKYQAIKEFAGEHGIDFYPAGTGIGHQVMVSMGYVLPGSLVVASDSHANMYGALGALGTPVVRTDAAAVWATGEFWWQIPRTVEVVLEGELPRGATGKDVIITLCGLYNQGEVLNAVVEFYGPRGRPPSSMDARFSISNMTTEWGALAGWFPTDRVTLDYLRERKSHLEGLGVERITDADLASWEEAPLSPDPDASYAARIRLDLSKVSPHVSGPDSVQVMRSLAEMEEEGLPIHKAYLVSCVNSRLGGPGSGGRRHQGEEGGGGRRPLCGGGQRRDPGGRRGVRSVGGPGRGRSEGPAPGMWALHRLGHRAPGGRRGGDQRHEPELQGQDGLPPRPGLPGEPRGGGGLCGGGPGHGTRGLTAGPNRVPKPP